MNEVLDAPAQAVQKFEKYAAAAREVLVPILQSTAGVGPELELAAPTYRKPEFESGSKRPTFGPEVAISITRKGEEVGELLVSDIADRGRSTVILSVGPKGQQREAYAATIDNILPRHPGERVSDERVRSAHFVADGQGRLGGLRGIGLGGNQ